MKMKIIYIVTIIILIASTASSQIIPEYRFYNQNPFLINPACTGINSGISSNLGHKIQWAGFKDAPENTHFSIDGLITNSMGFGVIFNKQSLGLLNISNISLNYSYKVALGVQHTFAFVANINFFMNKISNKGLSNYELADPSLLSNNFNSTILATGTGISYRFKELGIDISSPVLLSYQEDKVMQQLFSLVSYNFYFSDKTWRVQPSSLIKYSRNIPFNADINLLVDWNTYVWSFITYNTSKKVAIAVGFSLEYIGVGYSYSYSLKPTSHFNSDTHEIVLQFSIPYSISKKDPLYIDGRNRNLFD